MQCAVEEALRIENLKLFFEYDKLTLKYKYNRTDKQQLEIDEAYESFRDSALIEKGMMDARKNSSL